MFKWLFRRKPLEAQWVVVNIFDRGPDTAHPGNPYRYDATLAKGVEERTVPYFFATEKPLPKVLKYVQQHVRKHYGGE